MNGLLIIIDAVIATVRAYLPPDGISDVEMISRIIAAVDCPEARVAIAAAKGTTDA